MPRTSNRTSRKPRPTSKSKSFPLPTSYEPMHALLVSDLPSGDGWQYEPKWDGFRCLVFKNTADAKNPVQLMSKNGQPLARYFPELVSAIETLGADRFVLDGEIVIPDPETGGLSFDALLQRIHPAESRIRKLATETPVTLILFDLLVEAGKSLVDQPLAKRRERLEAFFKKHIGKHNERITLSPETRNHAVAERWFGKVGGALDGIVAKRLDLPYQTGTREGMVKVKKMRTADCVVGGFRYPTSGSKTEIGSLLLGLYDNKGLLNHVGFCSSFSADERKQLLKKLTPLIEPPGFTGASPGGPSRWNGGVEKEWQPLRSELVVEVRYDHFTNGRFRHGTKLLRWRPDKSPRQCTMAQVKHEAKIPLLSLAG
jgi:ATP-dependent DNA ligase